MVHGRTKGSQSKKMKEEGDKPDHVRPCCHDGRFECHLKNNGKPVDILKQEPG